MKPEEFRKGRRLLGFSQNDLAKVFKVSSGRTIRKWESGERDIPGPAEVLMGFLVYGQPLPISPSRTFSLDREKGTYRANAAVPIPE
tara:strand:+ start:4847 stop:5107 length:261 start_codon:yes stop_codon:yes gene_type:complete